MQPVNQQLQQAPATSCCTTQKLMQTLQQLQQQQMATPVKLHLRLLSSRTTNSYHSSQARSQLQLQLQVLQQQLAAVLVPHLARCTRISSWWTC
jgi:hypothetical protein